MQPATINSFSVLFDDSFFTNLLKDRSQLSLKRDEKERWRIVILQDNRSQTPEDWKEIVDKVSILYCEVQKAGGAAFARFNLAEIKISFVNVTLAANVQTLYRFVSSPETVSEERSSILSKGSHKRLLPQISPHPKREKQLATSPHIHTLPISQETLILGFKDFSYKSRVLNRQDYLALMPADVFLIVGQGEEQRKIAAHRSILCLYDYWATMFKSSMTESNNNEIIIEDLSPFIFEILIDFLYQPLYVEYFTHDQHQPLHHLESRYAFDCQVYQELSQAADRFQIQFLLTLCDSRLQVLHHCLSHWYETKKQSRGPSSPNPESQRGAFVQCLLPYLSLLSIRQSIPSSLYPLGQPIAKSEEITLQDSVRDQPVKFNGSRILLASKNLYFRQLFFEQDNASTLAPLPPQWILQSFASFIHQTSDLDNQQHFYFLDTPQTYVEKEFFALFIQIFQDRENEPKAKIAQLVQSRVPFEFPLNDWFSYSPPTHIDLLALLAFILQHFGASIRSIILDNSDVSVWAPAYRDPQILPHILPLVVKHCPHLQELRIFNWSIPNLESIFQSLQKLETLKFQDCELEASELVEKPSSPALRKLLLWGNSFSAQAFQVLSSYAYKISHLNLFEENCDEAFYTFMQSIEKLNNCTLARLTEAQIKRLIELNINLSHITYIFDHDEVGSEGNHIEEWSEETLLLFSSRCSSLRDLPLRYCEALKEETVLTLINRHSELTHIFLNESMTDRILECIGQKSKTLKEFDCGSKQFTLEGLKNMLLQLPSLRKVTIRDEKKMQALRTLYPDICFTFC